VLTGGKNASVAIASNESFSDWTKTFTTPGSAPPSWTAHFKRAIIETGTQFLPPGPRQGPATTPDVRLAVTAPGRASRRRHYGTHR